MMRDVTNLGIGSIHRINNKKGKGRNESRND